LGTENFQSRSAAYHEMADYYQSADIFTLGSLREGFGRVFLEAMSYGLPCLANDYEVTRFVLGEAGYFGKLAERGSLSTLIQQVLSNGLEAEKRYSRHQHIYEKFSWDKLRSSYVEMIHGVCNHD
jgi:1,2-diacylglycerol 3-alpha-glucosyltransferase